MGIVFGTFLKKKSVAWLKLHSTCPGEHYNVTDFLDAMSSLKIFIGF